MIFTNIRPRYLERQESAMVLIVGVKWYTIHLDPELERAIDPLPQDTMISWNYNIQGFPKKCWCYFNFHAFVVRYQDKMIPRFFIRNFKILAGLCSWASQFVSSLVGDSRRHIFTWRDSNDFITDITQQRLEKSSSHKNKEKINYSHSVSNACLSYTKSGLTLKNDVAIPRPLYKGLVHLKRYILGTVVRLWGRALYGSMKNIRQPFKDGLGTIKIYRSTNVNNNHQGK